MSPLNRDIGLFYVYIFYINKFHTPTSLTLFHPLWRSLFISPCLIRSVGIVREMRKRNSFIQHEHYHPISKMNGHIKAYIFYKKFNPNLQFYKFSMAYDCRSIIHTHIYILIYILVYIYKS